MRSIIVRKQVRDHQYSVFIIHIMDKDLCRGGVCFNCFMRSSRAVWVNWNQL